MSAIRRALRLGSIVFGLTLAVPVVPAFAQALSYGPVGQYQPVFPQYAPQPPEPQAQEPDGATSDAELPSALRRQVVGYQGNEAPGTIIIDTAHTFLYLTLGDGKALRYGIGVGRQGFT